MSVQHPAASISSNLAAPTLADLIAIQMKEISFGFQFRRVSLSQTFPLLLLLLLLLLLILLLLLLLLLN